MSDEVRVEEEAGEEVAVRVTPTLSWSNAEEATAPQEPAWLKDYKETPAGCGGSRRKWGGRYWVPKSRTTND